MHKARWFVFKQSTRKSDKTDFSLTVLRVNEYGTIMWSGAIKTCTTGVYVPRFVRKHSYETLSNLEYMIERHTSDPGHFPTSNWEHEIWTLQEVTDVSFLIKLVQKWHQPSRKILAQQLVFEHLVDFAWREGREFFPTDTARELAATKYSYFYFLQQSGARVKGTLLLCDAVGTIKSYANIKISEGKEKFTRIRFSESKKKLLVVQDIESLKRHVLERSACDLPEVWLLSEITADDLLGILTKIPVPERGDGAPLVFRQLLDRYWSACVPITVAAS